MRERQPAKMRRTRLLLAVVVAVFAIANFIRVDSGSHSVSDTLINWVPETALFAVLALAAIALVERFRSGRGHG